MNLKLTDITVLLDRSGSMTMLAKAMEEGYTSFMRDQAAAADDCVVSLVQFDTYDPAERVYTALPVKEAAARGLKLVPRAGTPLYDAIGVTIEATGQRLKLMPEATRPGLVVFVVITDGEENESRRWTKAQVEERIKHQTDAYNWQFVYLGANQDAWKVAEGLGISARHTMTYSPDRYGTQSAYSSTSSTLLMARGVTASGGGARAQSVAMDFSDADYEHQTDLGVQAPPEDEDDELGGES